MSLLSIGAQDAPYGQPSLKREAQGTRRVEHLGALFFRPFHLFGASLRLTPSGLTRKIAPGNFMSEY